MNYSYLIEAAERYCNEGKLQKHIHKESKEKEVTINQKTEYMVISKQGSQKYELLVRNIRNK